MENKYRITTLPPEDWKQYKELRLRSLETDPQAFGATYADTVAQEDERWSARLERDPHVFVHDIDTDMLVGMAGAFSTDGTTYTINQMWIDPIARGKGLGKQVIEGIIREAQSRGATTIQLYVNVQQTAAVELYKKMGFEIVSTEKDMQMGDGSVVDEYLMELLSKRHNNSI